MRVMFVDGPMHGNTMNFEGEPPRTLYTPALQATTISARKLEEDYIKPYTLYKHVYGQLMKSRQGTYIYQYFGTDPES